MTYSPNIPQPGDDPSQSQPLILANFQQLNIQYGTAGDHIEWTASSQNGKHKKVTLRDQSASLPLTAGLNEMLIYSNTQSGITWPYYTRDNIATVIPLSPIKTYARLTMQGANNNPTIIDSFNVTSVTASGGNVYLVTMTNALLNTNYGIFIIPQTGGITTWNITGANTFTFTTVSAAVLNNTINFMVLQN